MLNLKLIELYADVIELREMGLTEEEIEGYIEMFYGNISDSGRLN